MKTSIMIIDDEQGICASLSLILQNQYEVITFTDPEAALEHLALCSCALVLLDLKLGRYDGIEVLKKIKATDRGIQVIMMTAFGSIESSVEAIKNGAFTYVCKPLNVEEVCLYIEQALEFSMLSEQVSYLSGELQARYHYYEMVGKSPPMRRIYQTIEKLKDSNISIMITGESGTGKELIARAVHYLGARKNKKFVAINCAAIPEGLMEEEFFGHKRGAFTGAISDRKGKVALADGGTLFLDEIGDMPLQIQGKLLRVLQQREFSPVGSNEVVSVDVRIIAATNKDLHKMVRCGAFREDLFYRLNVVQIALPCLKDRTEDIPLLICQFIEESNREHNRQVKGLTKRAEHALLSYHWPGNVRELQNAIEYAVILSEGQTIDLFELPSSIQNNDTINGNGSLEELVCNRFADVTLDRMERMLVHAALERHGGHYGKAAKALGCSERGLRKKVLRHQQQNQDADSAGEQGNAEY